MCKTPFDLCAVECDMPRHFGLPLCSCGVCLCQACRKTRPVLKSGAVIRSFRRSVSCVQVSVPGNEHSK